MRYRAEVFISGAVTEKVYRDTLAGVERAATKRLTHWEPGVGNLWPKRYEIAENLGQIDGNTSKWKVIKIVQYEAIPGNQHEWRKRAALRLQS